LEGFWRKIVFFSEFSRFFMDNEEIFNFFAKNIAICYSICYNAIHNDAKIKWGRFSNPFLKKNTLQKKGTVNG